MIERSMVKLGSFGLLSSPWGMICEHCVKRNKEKERDEKRKRERDEKRKREREVRRFRESGEKRKREVRRGRGRER